MAPPRKGAIAAVDDSRSEASSGAREPKGASSKGRKTAGSAKPTANAANVTSAPAAQSVEQADNLPRVLLILQVRIKSFYLMSSMQLADKKISQINWSEMPVEILHSYRQAHGLSTPSAFSNDYSRILLSQGIGLRSPTTIAARRAQLTQSRNRGQEHPESNHISSAGVSNRNGLGRRDQRKDRHGNIIGQGRVSKNQLALSVRKHFNSAALVEQEAIARFLYKVREEGRGRQFRLRFQP